MIMTITAAAVIQVKKSLSGYGFPTYKDITGWNCQNIIMF